MDVKVGTIFSKAISCACTTKEERWNLNLRRKIILDLATLIVSLEYEIKNESVFTLTFCDMGGNSEHCVFYCS